MHASPCRIYKIVPFSNVHIFRNTSLVRSVDTRQFCEIFINIVKRRGLDCLRWACLYACICSSSLNATMSLAFGYRNRNTIATTPPPPLLLFIYLRIPKLTHIQTSIWSFRELGVRCATELEAIVCQKSFIVLVLL